MMESEIQLALSDNVSHTALHSQCWRKGRFPDEDSSTVGYMSSRRCLCYKFELVKADVIYRRLLELRDQISYKLHLLPLSHKAPNYKTARTENINYSPLMVFRKWRWLMTAFSGQTCSLSDNFLPEKRPTPFWTRCVTALYEKWKLHSKELVSTIECQLTNQYLQAEP